MRAVWENFKKMPEVLQKQTVQRFALSVLMFVLFISMWIATGSFTLSLPGLALAAYLGVSGGMLLHRGVSGGYIRITGIVTRLEASGFRKKVKWITMEAEGRNVQCPAPPGLKNLEVGDRVTLYLSPGTPIYEQVEVNKIFSYLALEQKRH